MNLFVAILAFVGIALNCAVALMGGTSVLDSGTLWALALLATCGKVEELEDGSR